MLRAPLPPGIEFDEPVRFCITADMRPDGSYGTEWLAVTGNHVHVLSQNATGVYTRHSLPLGELNEMKVETLVGGGGLEVTHLGRRMELLRFSSGRLPHFATAAGVVSRWLGGEEAVIPDGEQNRCPKCNLPLETGVKHCPACSPKSRTLWRLMGYLRPHAVGAISLMLLAMLNAALGLVPAYFNKPLIDDVLSPGSAKPFEARMHLLLVLVLALLGVHVLRSGIGLAQSWVSGWLGNTVVHTIRTQLFQHLQYLSLRFFDKRQIGSVISRVNQDSGQLLGFLVMIMQDPIINVLQIGGIGVVLFLLNWKLALIVFIPAPIVVLVSSLFWKHFRIKLHHFLRKWGRLNAVLNESLNGLRVVKAFAQEERVISRFSTSSSDLAVSGIQVDRFLNVIFSSFGLLIMLGTIVVWYIGGKDVLFGHMTTGQLIAFIAYTSMFYQPIQALSRIFDWCSRSLTAAERVFEILDNEPEINAADSIVRMPKIEGRVEFRHVNFGYERHTQTMKNVSFTVEPGEMIGLVGHSGAGKSTTINLLCRFYDTTGGEILIDGVPINKINIEDLRSQIGLVPQNTFLFKGTIADNIAYAKPHATREEIIRAAKIANAHDFIAKKPDGYETLIGENGGGLSGGEMQRLAIARAVLLDPRILILDEATSHVDVETEKQIQEATSRLVQGRTTFAIAHRLSTLKNADRLLVLKAGEIAEIGTHDELMANEEGEFHKLAKTYQEISNVRAIAR